jgi:translocation and assembly module TamB
LHAGVARVSWAPESVDAEGIDVEGLGAPLGAEFHATRGAAAVRLRAPSVDLTRVRTLLEDPRIPEGDAELSVDVRAERSGVTGRVDAHVRAGGAGDRPADLTMALDFKGRRLDGSVQARLDASRAQLRLTDLEASGPPAELASWRRTTGALDVDANVDLAAVQQAVQKLLPIRSLPYSCLAGQLALRAHVERRTPGQDPDARVDVSTTGLMIVGRSREPVTTYVDRPQSAKALRVPWQMQQIDARLKATLRAAPAEAVLDGTLVDRVGTLLTLHLQSRLRVADVARGLAAIAHAPFDLHAEVPRRDLALLPPVLRPGALRGSVASTVQASGTIVDPRLHVTARGWNIEPLQSQSAIPFTGTVDATYDGREALVRTRVSDPHGVVLDSRGQVEGRLFDLFSSPAAPAWNGALRVTLHDFPLQGAPPLATRGIAGRATGTLTLEGLHRDARLRADLRIDAPRLGAVPFQTGRVQVQVDGARLHGAVRLDGQNTHGAVTVEAETRWGDALAPTFVADVPVDATLEAQNFRAGAVLPFLSGVVDQLDGRVDAGVRARVSPDLKTGTFDGDVRLSKGLLEIPAVGEQFHDVAARFTVRPWGTLRLEGVRARGGDGQLVASGIAQLDGTRLKQAQLDVDIPKRMPVTLQGVALGEAQGEVHLAATMSEDRRRLDAAVRIPRFILTLSGSSGHSVQDLGPAPKIVIGTRGQDDRFVALPLHAPEEPRSPGSTALHVVIDLGNDVRIKRDAIVDVSLRGRPTLDVTDAAHLAGTIEIPRGTVELYGKRFQIDPGSSVAFTGDPANPQLLVTAQYDAPENVKLFADLKGDVRRPTIKLRSEPGGLSDDQMLGLLVFGSQEGLAGSTAPGEQPDPTVRAAGFAGGFVAEGLNKALSGLGSLEVSTRLDTTEAANPRPEVEVRVSNAVSTRLTVNTGVPAPGDSPDRTFVTLDWRFKPRWSLQTTLGDQGSTLLDFLWRHRY